MVFSTAALAALVAMVTLANGRDITGTNPSTGSCFCPNIGSLFIRDAPCGNPVGVAGYNQCFTYTGNKQSCTLDIEYEFFEINFNGETRWAAGNYLNLEQRSYCSQYPCGIPQPDNSGSDESSESRILGGTNAVRNAWPWQLILETSDGENWSLRCGAVLIDAEWVLTSAACLRDVQYPVRLLAGVYARADPVLPDQIRLVTQEDITVHPNFNTTTYENNIAIIRLTSAYDLSTNSIRNICLPPNSDSQFTENPTCYITGWGLTRADGITSADVLQRAPIDVLRALNCELLIGFQPFPSEVCTLDQASRTSALCDGDFGGPLSCAVNTRFQLAGVGSFMAERCNPSRPQVFASLPSYIDWIREITGID